MTPQPSEQPRPEWVRYRLTKGDSELTFRVIRGTAMILEQSDWHVESEYIEGRTYAPDPVPIPALDQPLMIPMPKGTTLVLHMPILMDGHTDGSVHVYPERAAAPDPVADPAPLDVLENFAGSGYCPGCKVAIDLHPWLEDDPDAIRCPKPREALDALYARLAQPVAEEPT